MKTLLSILIPITPDREDAVKPLFKILGIGEDLNRWSFSHKENALMVSRFYNESKLFEVVIASDNKEMTLGEKREWLYKYANGEYSWQIDSDDLISEDAIQLILNAIELQPDCITFQEHCEMNGKYFTSNHSLKYEDWADNFDGFDFTRTPFYKSVIKTTIAQSVPFEKIRYGEDHAWSRALKPHLKNEIHIDKELYYYIHNSKPEDHAERYGITG